MAKFDGPISASFLNPIIEEHRRWTIELHEWLLKEFYASGHPFGTEKLEPIEVYQTLISLMQAGHPEYWQSPEAQEELRKLEEKFGPAPPLQPQAQPMGQPMQPPMQGMM